MTPLRRPSLPKMLDPLTWREEDLGGGKALRPPLDIADSARDRVAVPSTRWVKPGGPATSCSPPWNRRFKGPGDECRRQ